MDFESQAVPSFSAHQDGAPRKGLSWRGFSQRMLYICGPEINRQADIKVMATLRQDSDGRLGGKCADLSFVGEFRKSPDAC